MGIPITLITILGGGHGVTTALAVGDRHGVTDMEALPARMFMDAGVTPPISAHRPRGPILLQETMAPEAAPPFKTRSAARLVSPGVEPIRISTQEYIRWPGSRCL